MTKWNFKEPDLTFSKGANKRNRNFDAEAKNIVDKGSRKLMVNILQIHHLLHDICYFYCY